MREGKFSRTAYRVAIRRAAHQLFDEPKVLTDPLALRIIGAAAAAELRTSREAENSIARAFRAFMAVRSRYAEDELARAVGSGVRQFVVLGAGLDTFAYRNPHKQVRVFEVDHPATQAWKRERLQAESIEIPANLTYVPVDFEHQTLAVRLQESGLDLKSPAFFSWLGVTPYLTHEAFLSTLTFIASMPYGSGVVFDFAIDSRLLSIKERLAKAAISARVAAAGEPFRLFFHPEELAAEMKSLGFSAVEILDREEINRRYFHNRADGLRIGGNLGQLLSAWV